MSQHQPNIGAMHRVCWAAFSFEYLYDMDLWPLEIVLLLQCGDRLQTSESDICRRQILTSKVDPCAVRVKALHWNQQCIGFIYLFDFPVENMQKMIQYH